jgi:hypothetical protein
VINNKECEDWHKSKGITVIIYDEMVCAGWRNGGRDACQVCTTLSFTYSRRYGGKYHQPLIFYEARRHTCGDIYGGLRELKSLLFHRHSQASGGSPN